MCTCKPFSMSATPLSKAGNFEEESLKNKGFGCSKNLILRSHNSNDYVVYFS